MRGFLLRFVVGSAALALTTRIMPGFHIERLLDLILAVVLLGFLNAIVRPILVLLTLPINFLTLGLFTFVINAVLLKATAYFIDGFRIDGWPQALVGAVVLSVVSALLNWLVKDKSKKED